MRSFLPNDLATVVISIWNRAPIDLLLLTGKINLTYGRVGWRKQVQLLGDLNSIQTPEAIAPNTFKSPGVTGILYYNST